MKQGFTIIEIIIAIFLLTVGVVGVFVLVNRALTQASVLSSRLVAAYLAQEGIEIVRNIRDTNWIKGLLWTDGIETLQDCGLDYDSNNCSLSLADDYLEIDGATGFYAYQTEGEQTKFQRIIRLRKFDTLTTEDTLEITSIVRWQERGETQEFKAKEAIYNWRQ